VARHHYAKFTITVSASMGTAYNGDCMALFLDVMHTVFLPFCALYAIIYVLSNQFSSVFRKLSPYDKNYW